MNDNKVVQQHIRNTDAILRTGKTDGQIGDEDTKDAISNLEETDAKEEIENKEKQAA